MMFFSRKVEIPEPPKLPEYDPKEEPPKWTWSRMAYGTPADKGDKPWTKVGVHPESPDDPDWRGVIRSKVSEFKIPEYKGLTEKRKNYYFWFDTPDYADPFKKLAYCARFFASVGALSATFISLGTPGPFTRIFNAQTVRILSSTFLSGMCAGATVIAIANLRGNKDDNWNYFFGGLTYATCIYRGSYYHWIASCLFYVPLAVFLKQNAETNGAIIPRRDFRLVNTPLSGYNCENGFFSGDVRFGLRSSYGDPGRDIRRPWA